MASVFMINANTSEKYIQAIYCNIIKVDSGVGNCPVNNISVMGTNNCFFFPVK